MDINSAIYVLIQGCELGQSRGAYKLTEAKQIADAIEYINSVSETNNTDNPTETNSNDVGSTPNNDGS